VGPADAVAMADAVAVANAVAVAVVVVAVAVTVAVTVAVADSTDVGCREAAYGTDGASLWAGIASLFRGYSPLARNPLLMCSGLNEASHNLLIKPGKGIIATENESAKLCFIFHNVLYFPLENIVLEVLFCTCYNRPVEVVLMLMQYG